MLEAYIDESQSFAPAPRVFVLAGYLATPERWNAFSRGWDEKLVELDIDPPFKFSQSMMGKSEELRHFSMHQIKEYIEAYAQMRVAFAMRLDDLDIAMKGVNNKEHSSPYFAAFFSMIAISSYNRDFKEFGGIRYIFDRRDQDENSIHSAWKYFANTAPRGRLEG